MSNQIFEIMTKATIAKGHKRSVDKYHFEVEHIDKILGCWICNHCFEAKIEKGKPIIYGSLEMHVWYSYLNDSHLLKKVVQYQEMIDLNCSGHILNNQDELKVSCQKIPKCIHANLNKQIIELEIEKELALKIIGETTIMVENKHNIVNDSDQEIKVNTDFIT